VSGLTLHFEQHGAGHFCKDHALTWQYPEALELITASDMHWVRDFCREKPRPVCPRADDWLGYVLHERLKGFSPRLVLYPGGRAYLLTDSTAAKPRGRFLFLYQWHR
jgi:hypothetical protein